MAKYRRKPGPVVEAHWFVYYPFCNGETGDFIRSAGCSSPRLLDDKEGLLVWVQPDGSVGGAKSKTWLIKDAPRGIKTMSDADFSAEYEPVQTIDFGGPEPVYFPDPAANALGAKIESMVSESVHEAMRDALRSDPLDSPVEGDIVNWDPEASGGDTPSNWDNPEAADESVCGEPTKTAAELIAEKMLSAALRPAFPRHPDYTRGVVTAEGVFDA